jgi:uncharacterized protein YkwD
MSKRIAKKFRPCVEGLETRVQLSATLSSQPVIVLSMVRPAGVTLDALSLTSSLRQQEAQILTATNKFRAQNRLGTLRTNRILQRVAQAHSANMARQEKLDHVLNGLGPAQRVTRAGYRFALVAENVAFASFLNVNSIMQGWIRSPGHRRNLLERSATEIGIGAARSAAGNWYYTQVFGRPLTF